MIKNSFNKLKFFFQIKSIYPLIKFQNTLFSNLGNKHYDNFRSITREDTKTENIIQKVNLLDQIIRNHLKQGQNKLLEEEIIKKTIKEIDQFNSLEGYENPFLVNKLIYCYSLLKIIPNQKLLNSILNCIEVQVN